jgi:hypothetical protein
MADALSQIPTVEIFNFKEEQEFPLNLATLAQKQFTDDHLQKKHYSKSQPPKSNHNQKRTQILCLQADEHNQCTYNSQRSNLTMVPYPPTTLWKSNICKPL